MLQEARMILLTIGASRLTYRSRHYSDYVYEALTTFQRINIDALLMDGS